MISEEKVRFKYMFRFCNEVSREIVMIRWQPPPIEWTKLNCDRSSKNDTGQAGCGGLRDPTKLRWNMVVEICLPHWDM